MVRIAVDERARLGRLALGARIRSVRTNAGIAAADAAAEAGISYSYLSDVERGRRAPTLEVLDSLAQALGVTVVKLLTGLYPWDDSRVPNKLESPPDGRSHPQGHS